MKINKIEAAYDYAEGIRSGSITVCKYIRLAVERYFDMHNRADELGIEWDEEAAQHVLTFFELLRFTAGKCAGKPFKLEGWQSFLLANLFGWMKETEDGKVRVFRECYIEIPKKSGKTELAAGLAIYMLIADGEAGAQVYAAAYTRDQAKLCFGAAQEMINKSPQIKRHVRSLKNHVSVPSTYSQMAAVSHDAKNSEGKNAHFVSYDEFHVHLTDKLKMSLESGMAGRTQPILFTPTTAGDNKTGPCYEFRETCISILEGNSAITDTFALIYTIDEGDDWEDPEVWKKANPNLGVSKQMDYLQNKFKKAKENGRERVDFKTKQLNIWEDSAITWIPSETWNAGSRPDKKISTGARWYGGIDLGWSSDIASFAVFFPDEKHLKVKHYVSEQAAEYAVKGGNSYKRWIEEGYLIATPGKVTDYEFIRDDVFEAASEWELMFLGFDPYSAQIFRKWLEDELGTIWAPVKKDDGTLYWDYRKKVQPFRQGMISLGPPTKQFGEMVINGEITHDGNPVTAWMLQNVALDSDSAGNHKPNKEKSRFKIDGIVASIMAIGEYALWDDLLIGNDSIGVY